MGDDSFQKERIFITVEEGFIYPRERVLGPIDCTLRPLPKPWLFRNKRYSN